MGNLWTLDDLKTWPPKLLTFIEENYDAFRDWVICGGNPDYDRWIPELEKIISDINPEIIGYHCTKLMKHEIQAIKNDGLKPLSKELLHERIDKALNHGFFTEEEANYFKEENQASKSCRAGMIWFCCYPLHSAGEGGLCRFFHSWGGEALYNKHEASPHYGGKLRSLGQPCVVKARISMKDVIENFFFPQNLIRKYLSLKGFELQEDIKFDACIKVPVCASKIEQIIRYPDDEEFTELTACNEWLEKLPYPTS